METYHCFDLLASRPDFHTATAIVGVIPDVVRQSHAEHAIRQFLHSRERASSSLEIATVHGSLTRVAILGWSFAGLKLERAHYAGHGHGRQADQGRVDLCCAVHFDVFFRSDTDRPQYCECKYGLYQKAPIVFKE